MRTLIYFGIAVGLSLNSYAQGTIRIPDIGLEEALIDLKIDTNGLNGNILVTDAEYVVNLNISEPLTNKKLPNVHSKIKDLSGIEYFPNLTRLDCSGNEISKMNLSRSFKLTFLNCSDNKLESIDVSNSPDLRALNCDYNKLTSLKLGEKTALRDLYCNNNQLTSLNLKGCSVLENLDASGNRLAKIIVNPQSYTKNKDAWYKDAATVYTDNENLVPVVEETKTITTTVVKNTPQPTTTTSVVNNTQPQESTSNYFEKFQLSVANEYDKLVLAPNHLKNKKDIIQQKYKLNPNDLNEWINKYASFKRASNTSNNFGSPQKNSVIFYNKFKKLAVDEYEKAVLNSAYLQSKKQEIIKKYNIKPTEFTQWISELGTPTLKARTQTSEDAASYYDKFKQSVVKEYENLVLNANHLSDIKTQLQKKYNITSTQLSDWIRKNSKVKSLL
ncbi:leucine-rich repeat domain-containing protein [Tenacibaculum holothuriorum]|uniref:leucine-rich repeat domain-containing protein n=1 Tax=Tenacibaculum holothuriorum TaxID=1635173 RepID=UPI000A32764D|nr:hypothetical protein [Tenacibaculum holothuriorum]